MKIIFRNTYIIILILSLFSCKKEINSTKSKTSLIKTSDENFINQQPSNIKTKDSLIIKNNVKIDSVSISEIKRFSDEELPTIFDYYKQEKIEEYSNWSPKLFGRCCSNTDISFTENLFFKISSNIDNKKHPISNISDTEYLTAFAFKPGSKIKIDLELDLNNSYLEGNYSNKKILKPNEVIMNPIRLSLINGYTKSKELFYKNGRIKEMEFYVNNKLTQTVVLMDTPLVQEITINSFFNTNDIITLIPKSYYSGSHYDDICISEIQTNLGEVALTSLNKKFNLIELMNKDN